MLRHDFIKNTLVTRKVQIIKCNHFFFIIEHREAEAVNRRTEVVMDKQRKRTKEKQWSKKTLHIEQH